MDDTTKLGSVDISAYMAGSMEALEKMARLLGYESDAKELASEYAHLKFMMNTKLWNETEGTYFDWDYRKNAHVKVVRRKKRASWRIFISQFFPKRN